MTICTPVYNTMTKRLRDEPIKAWNTCPYPNCQYRTNQARCLRSHIKFIHTAEKTVKCLYDCGYKTKTSGSILSHIAYIHFPRLGNDCDYCDFGSENKYTLVNHIAVWHDDTPIGKAFNECKGIICKRWRIPPPEIVLHKLAQDSIIQ